jgi:hypothetical protein
LLSGFIDLAFLLLGIMFVGIIASIVGLVISRIWYKERLRLNKEIRWPFYCLAGNIMFLICATFFILFVFSDGVAFMM